MFGCFEVRGLEFGRDWLGLSLSVALYNFCSFFGRVFTLMHLWGVAWLALGVDCLWIVEVVSSVATIFQERDSV